MVRSEIRSEPSEQRQDNQQPSSSTSNDKLKYFQRLIFSTMFLGYAVYAYNRKSVSFALPELMQEGIGKSEAGLIISSQNLAYAISKFWGGILSDHISSKLLFSSGLVVSGVATLGFACSNATHAFVALWFLNGLAQGCGWPACAKVLRQWFSPAQFGTWWSVLSASANISGGLAPFVSAYIILHYGWQTSLVVAGTVSIVHGILSLLLITDSPTHVGLKSFAPDLVEKSKGDHNTEDKSSSIMDLLKSPFLWLVSLSYMVVFCAKTSAVDWGQLYLMEDRKRSQYVGSAFTSSVESGGFFGGIIAGYLTDLVLKLHFANPNITKGGSPRWPVAVFFMAGVTLSLHALYFFVDENTSQFLITLIGFILGACLYGPIAIFGVVATESAPTHLSGTAHAIVALAANVGAITSGFPFSYIAKAYNWAAIFWLLEIVTGATTLIMFLARNVNATIGKSSKPVIKKE